MIIFTCWASLPSILPILLTSEDGAGTYYTGRAPPVWDGLNCLTILLVRLLGSAILSFIFCMYNCPKADKNISFIKLINCIKNNVHQQDAMCVLSIMFCLLIYFDNLAQSLQLGNSELLILVLGQITSFLCYLSIAEQATKTITNTLLTSRNFNWKCSKHLLVWHRG